MLKVLATLFVCASMISAVEIPEEDSYDEVVWSLSEDNVKSEKSYSHRSASILPTAYYNNESLYFTAPLSMTITYSIMEDENVKGGALFSCLRKRRHPSLLPGCPKVLMKSIYIWVMMNMWV